MLSEAAKAEKRKYQQQWYAKNRDKANLYQKNWRVANPERKKELDERYWERKANSIVSKG